MKIDFFQAWKTVQGLLNGFIASTPKLLLGLLLFVGFYFAAKGVRRLIERIVNARRRHRNIGLVLGRLAQAGLVAFGLLVALVIAVPSFRPGQLVQLLGIGSVAIGFAFRDILQNFLAGLLLLWTEPFRINDQIIVGGFEGTVEDIQTRATMLRTYDGRRIVIPNSKLFIDSVIVNTAFDSRRLEYDIGIGYGDDVEHARLLVLKTLKETEGVLAEPAPEVLLMELAPSSVNLRARWWIQPPRMQDTLDSRDVVLRAVKRTLTENGIDLPFPTTQVLFHDQTEETDGDRARQREGWPKGKAEPPRPRPVLKRHQSV